MKKWAWIADDSPMCTECGKVFNTNDNADAGLWDFCPNCGASMKEEAEKPCEFKDTCIGACEWCESHEYSKACVPMLQAKKVLYLCNREKCDDCSYPVCQHTADIKHAKNFKSIEVGAIYGYIEKENENANH